MGSKKSIYQSQKNPGYAPGQNAPQISNNNRFSTNSTAFAEIPDARYWNFGGAAVHSAPPFPPLLAHTTRGVGEAWDCS